MSRSPTYPPPETQLLASAVAARRDCLSFEAWWSQFVMTEPTITVRHTDVDPRAIKWPKTTADRRLAREAVAATRPAWRAAYLRRPATRAERGVALLGAPPTWQRQPPVREQVMATLAKAPDGLLARDVAVRANLNEGTVRDALNHLASDGVAVTDPRRSSWPPRWHAVPEHLVGLPVASARKAMFGVAHRATLVEDALAAVDATPRTAREVAAMAGRDARSTASVLRRLAQAGLIDVDGRGGPRAPRRYRAKP